MPSRAEDLEAAIIEATEPGFRARLLARGEARGLIWRDGALPPGTPSPDAFLSQDLLAYAYALLEHGLEISALQGSAESALSAFETAATAIEAVIARGEATPERGFHRVVAAATFHLAHFSARAYSLLHMARDDQDTSLAEHCLVRLMLRDFGGLHDFIIQTRGDGQLSDSQLAGDLRVALEPTTAIESGDDTDGVIDGRCQSVVATGASRSCRLKTSRGVRNPRVWRGRSLSSSAIALR
jgi:hypothetical protein